jgi:transcriptional activator HAC1
MDATMEALRLVSTEAYAVDRVFEGGVRAAAAANGKEQQQQAKGWLNGTKLPSKEVLMTLLWVLRVEERRIQIRRQADSSSSKLGRLDALKTTAPTNTFILKVRTKRSLGGGLLGNPDGYSLKRRRVE